MMYPLLTNFKQDCETCCNSGFGGLSKATYRRTSGVWHAPWLTRQLHGLPHLNLTLCPVNPYYNPYSEEYMESVILLSLVPTIAVLFILALFFGLKCCIAPKNTCPNNVCRCIHQRWLCALRFGCLLAFFLGLLFELRIHQTVSTVIYTDVYLPNDVLNIKEHGQQYDIQKTGLSFDKVLKIDTKPGGLFYGMSGGQGWNKEAIVDPYRFEVGRYMQEMQVEVNNLQNPPVEPVKLKPQPIDDKFRFFENIRFLVSMLLWFVSLFLTCNRCLCPQIAAILGLVWCCFRSMYLINVIMRIADICIYPGIYIKQHMNRTQMLNDTKEAVITMCHSFNKSVEAAKPTCKEIVDKWHKIFKTHATYTLYNHKSDAGNFDMNSANKDPRYVYSKAIETALDKAKKEKACDQLTEGKKKLDCKKQAEDFDELTMPTKNYLPLCENDAVLKWFFLQLIAVLLAELFYLINLMLAFRITVCRAPDLPTNQYCIPVCVPTCGTLQQKRDEVGLLSDHSCKAKKKKVRKVKTVKDKRRCKCGNPAGPCDGPCKVLEAARRTGGKDVLVVDLNDQNMLLLVDKC